MHIAIIGATGLVGREIHAQLLKRNFPCTKLSLFAKSSHQNISSADWSSINLAFFAAGHAVSKHYIPGALEVGCRVIDSSSAYRATAPLVIPEINANLIANASLISSPNCTTSIMLMALYPLHQNTPVKRIIASTYQAASGGGYPLMQKLQTDPLNYPLHLHDGEEEKIRFETRKILQMPTLPISCRCVRVPVLRAHSLSLYVEFASPIENPDTLIQNAPGIQLADHPTPHDASNKEYILCDHIRQDQDNPNAYELWIVGDQLLKGAALNAVQIAEHAKALNAV